MIGRQELLQEGVKWQISLPLHLERHRFCTAGIHKLLFQLGIHSPQYHSKLKARAETATEMIFWNIDVISKSPSSPEATDKTFRAIKTAFPAFHVCISPDLNLDLNESVLDSGNIFNQVFPTLPEAKLIS